MLTYLFKRQEDLIWSYLIPRLSDYSNRQALCFPCIRRQPEILSGIGLMFLPLLPLGIFTLHQSISCPLTEAKSQSKVVIQSSRCLD